MPEKAVKTMLEESIRVIRETEAQMEEEKLSARARGQKLVAEAEKAAQATLAAAEKMLRDYQSYVFMWNKRCSLRGAWASVLAAVMTLIQDGAAYIYLVALLLDGSIGVGDFVFYFSAVGSIAAFLTGIVSDVATLNTRAEKIAYYRNVYDSTMERDAHCLLPQSRLNSKMYGINIAAQRITQSRD